MREALAVPGCVIETFATRAVLDRHPELAAVARGNDVPVQLVSGEVMSAMCQTVTPQGVVAVCGFVDQPLSHVVADSLRLVAVLADARDPGNVGTIIRAADAAGADAVVLAGATVDPYNGKCVRASAGSLFHLPVVAGVAVDDVLQALRAAELSIVAADGTGDRDLDAGTDDGLLQRPTAWVFGNEAWGLPQEIRDRADHVVRVPIYGRAESLNLATAAAVCLYASARAQRRAHRSPSTPPGADSTAKSR